MPDQNNRIKAIDSDFINAVNKDYAASEALIKEGLQQLSDMSINTVPESIFIRDFLPMFSGEAAMDNNLLSTWYLISNGPFGYVNVVNRNNVVVIKIPPFKDRDSVPVWDKKDTINKILIENEALNVISPRAAQNALAYELDKRYFGDGDVIVKESKLQLEWKAVMVHYGKIKESKSNAVTNVSVDDDIEYE